MAHDARHRYGRCRKNRPNSRDHGKHRALRLWGRRALHESLQQRAIEGHRQIIEDDQRDRVFTHRMAAQPPHHIDGTDPRENLRQQPKRRIGP